MAHTVTPFDQSAQLLQTHRQLLHIKLPSIPVYTLFAFSITALLVLISLRMIGALFVIESPVIAGVNTLTQPFVAPFAYLLHENGGMIQFSSGLAFSVYYGLYWVGALTNRFIGEI